MRTRRYDKRSLIAIGVVYFLLIVGGLTAGFYYRAEVGSLVADIRAGITPSPTVSN